MHIKYQQKSKMPSARESVLRSDVPLSGLPRSYLKVISLWIIKIRRIIIDYIIEMMANEMNALNIRLNEDKLGCWSIVVGICENIFGQKHVME